MEAIIDYRGKTPNKTTHGIPLVTAKIIKGGRIQEAKEFIAHSDYEGWMRRGLPEVGDVLITTEAPLGEVAQLTSKKVALAQRVILLRGKKGRLDNTYLRFLLQSSDVQHKLRARSSGTTVSGIKQRELRKVEIALPPIDEQRRIAAVLGALDDKIELNRKMNRTLEEMAQAIFKSWFIDFDGVDASEMVDSELGPIPKGWEVLPVGDATQVLGGSTPKTKVTRFWEGGMHCWTTPKDLSSATSPILMDTARRVTDAGVEAISSGLLPAGTFLMSSRAPVGYTAIAVMPIAVNQGYVAIPPGGRVSPLFLLHWARENMDVIKSRAGGTTFMEISKRNFRPIPLAVPEPETAGRFEAVASALFRRIENSDRQSRTLASLRDLLLPKLISGEIRVPAAEKALEAAL